MSDEYQVRGIPSALIEKMWPFAEPYVKRALDHTFGEIAPLDLKNGCLARDMQLWMAAKNSRVMGAGTTEIVLYPQMKVCRVITLAGTEFDAWRELALNIIRNWALEQDCQAMECYVRKGFVPKLQELGFKHKYSVCHLNIRE